MIKATLLEKAQKKFLNIPNSATSDEWYEWETETKKKHPILYFILKKMCRKIRRWRFVNITEQINEYKGKYYYKPHCVKIDIERFPINWSNKRSRQYFTYSSSDKFLYTNFQMLVDVFETKTKDQIEYLQTADEVAEAWGKLEVLYIWWTKDRPARDKSIPKLTDYGLSDNFWGKDENGIDNDRKPEYKDYEKAMKKMGDREERYKKIDDEMLETLMANREHLRT